NIQTCSGQATLLSIKNIGTVEERYVVKSDSTQVQVSIDPESIVLKPGEEGRISVFVKGKSNTPTGDYVIPIKVYYDGGYYYYNYTPYYTRNVEVNCGNGNKQTVYCNGGSGSCSVDCYYSSQGIYTVTSGIGGTTCKSTQVNVGDSYASCAISASPHYLDSGSSTSITLNYKNLPYLPGTVSIDCGNGGTTSVDCSSSLPFNATFRITNTDGNSDILTLRKGETSQGFGFSIYVIALYKKGFYYHANISISNQSSADIDLTPGDSVTSANGVNVTLLGINPSTSATSGSCVGSCYYSSSGFYTVTASMSGVTCNPTLVNSGPQVSSCALSASPYSVSPGGYSTISLNYFGAYNIDSYQRYSSTRYYDGPVTTQNLLVHVTPGCGTGFVPPTVSPAGIEISSIAGDALSSTGEIRLGIALKNNNNYPIDAVQLRVINLPSNVYATSSTVSLDALREKTAFIYLRSEGVKEGSYRIKVIAESSLGYAEKEFTLQVFPKGEKIDAVISEPRISISRQDSKTRMDIAFPITNNEEFPLRLSGYFTSLPSGWEYSVEPALLTANPKQTANFTATIIARSPEAREYMGVFVVKSTDGRTSSTPFTLAIREGFPLTGLFVFATSEPFLIALLVFMFAVAGYLIYASRKNIEELRKRSEAEASEKPPSAGRRRLYL
ncbi:hypothetical protein HZC09_06045, partial [Candidatus Micrarchaeota archaeon]|nr:hypothetical protein [Candidatus Micrarchaeota archaeon]